MKKQLFLLFSIGLFMLSGCDSTETPQNVSTSDPTIATTPQVVRESSFQVQTNRDFDVTSGEHGYISIALIEHMNDHLPNRLAFSDRELETAEWIVSTLIEMGFDESQIEMQTFSVDAETSSWWGSAEWMVEWFMDAGYYSEVEFVGYSQNVILTLPGRSAETIIIGAHYDGMANPGMSDNASGTVLLMENAYWMQSVDHYYTLQYVFFGAEEVGLIGSFYFTDNMAEEEIDNLIFMINADVILDGPDLIYAVGYADDFHNEVNQNAFTESIKSLADQLNASGQTQLISKPHALFLPSDQLAFIDFGVPVMVFYATHPVSYPETFSGDVLHSPDDNLDFLMQNHSGRIERALFEFGLFLEAITMSENIR